MTGSGASIAQGETAITVRYWAAARAAAGVGEDRIVTDGPLSLAEVRERALALHPGADGLARVIAACSVLVGDAPVGRRDAAEVMVSPGASVEFLPPFAGG
jgi:molybdopterin converting factor small subunit